MSNSNSTSSKIVYLRESNGISQEDFAASLSIDLVTLAAIEEGTKPDEKLLEKMALLFQVPLSYLTNETPLDDKSLNHLTRAMEKLSKNDHNELLKFAEFLQSVPRDKD